MTYSFPGVRPGSRPASETFVITPVEILDKQFDDMQQGIRIDNLSYVWLYVEPLRRFVPPLRLGWRSSIMPASRAIRVTPLPSPTGQTPIGQGGHINIEVSTFSVGDSEGSDTSYLPEWGALVGASTGGPAFQLNAYQNDAFQTTESSAGSGGGGGGGDGGGDAYDFSWVPQAPETPETELHTTTGNSVVANDIETYNVEIETAQMANTTSQHNVSFLAAADTSIRLRIMQLKYIALGGNPPLAWVEVHTEQGGGNPIAYLGVSPGMPTDWIIIPDSGVLLPYDITIPGISLFLKARADKSRVNLRLLFGYHPVET